MSRRKCNVRLESGARRKSRSLGLRSTRLLPRRCVIRAIALTGLCFAVGCGSTSRVVVHTFDTVPATLVDLPTVEGGARGRLTAPIQVRRHHLELSSERALVESTSFPQLKGTVDLAFAGGDGRGLAGVFLRRSGQAKLLCLALRPRGVGESRVYRSDDPFQPSGGAGWKSRDGGPTGFVRLGFAARGDEVEFRIDGEVVGRQTVSAAGSPGGGPAVWQVGLFSRGIVSRWNSFVIGDPEPSTPGRGGEFSPASFVDWGDASTAEGLFREFAESARGFAQDPSRDRVFELAAALEGALNSCRQSGDRDRLDRMISQANDVASKLSPSARRIGENELWVTAFRDTARSGDDRERLLGAEGSDFAKRAQEASARKHFAEALVWTAAALEVKSTRDGLDRFEELSRRVPGLGFAFRFDGSKARKDILPEGKFRDNLTAKYGGLPRRGDGLVVDLRVGRSDLASDVEKAVRRVSVSAEGLGMSEAERKELERLGSSRAEDLREALAGAAAIQASAQVLGRDALEHLGEFRLDGKTYELHLNDGKRLERDFARYRKLKERWDSLASKTRTEEIAAERTTISIWFRASLEVSFRGETVVSGEQLSEYMGLELWKHGGDSAKGIQATRPTNRDLRDALDVLRGRIVRRFDRLTSKENVITKLSPDERMAFLIQLARGSGRGQDEISLRWALEKEFGLSSVLRDRVARRLLK